MLSVYEGFPNPDRKDDVVPALQLKLVALVLIRLKTFLTELFNRVLIDKFVLRFEIVFKLLPPLFELINSIISLLILHGVLYDSQVFVEIEHSH